MKSVVFIMTLSCCLFTKLATAQDSSLVQTQQLPGKYFDAVNNKLTAFNKHSQEYTQVVIDRIIRQEKKMQTKMSRADASLAKKIFAYSIDSLQKLKMMVRNKSKNVSTHLSGRYFPYIDTLKQSLAFLKGIKSLANNVKNIQAQAHSSLQLIEDAQNNLQNIEHVELYIKQRAQILKEYVNKFPQLAGNLKKISKEAYYYRAQVNEYKLILKHPDKIERVVLDLVKKTPAFQAFIQQNSQLSGLFASPASFTGMMNSSSMPVINGLASRASLQNFILATIPTNNSSQVIQQLQQQLINTASQSDRLVQTLNNIGGMKTNSIPDFKPNSQRTKTFWNRVEYGTDYQFGKSVHFLPATGNLALKLGYKLNDKSTAGVGVNYIMGLGQGWNHISLSHQGIGLRTYLKWKIKKGLDVQGGGEWNYMLQFKNIEELKNQNAWQRSALIGISKNYAIGKKLKGNVQVLFDCLYKKHLPVTQPVVFRFGYGRS